MRTQSPSLVVVSSASKSRKQHLTPGDREGTKIDAVGHNFYSLGALGITSYMACVAWYSYALWERLLDILELLPDDKHTKCWFLQKYGMQLGKQLLVSAKYVLDLFAKMVTSALSLRRHAWLCSMDLQLDAKSIIEDLHFEGEGLFSATTDSVLQEIDKSIKGFENSGNFGFH